MTLSGNRIGSASAHYMPPRNETHQFVSPAHYDRAA